jgi:hypothetical protein
MTVKLKNLNSTEQHLVDVTTTELNEINGGALGAAAGQTLGRIEGKNTKDSNDLGIAGAQIGGGIGVLGGGIVGGFFSAATGPFSLITAAPSIGTGAIGGGAVGASLSD